jgi:flagellin
MSISSLTNTTASTAQRALSTNTTMLSKSLTQLATGLQNNRASDNASAQAISAKLNAVIKTLEQASRNTAQGGSLIQLVAGAQTQIIDMLTQAQVLAATSVSDALSSSDRAKSDAAYQKLLLQIDATANQTRWNGVALLNGGAGTVVQPGITGAVAAIASTGGGTLAAGITANTFNAGVVAGSSTGFVSGVATDCSVVTNGSLYDVSMTVGNQVFKTTTGIPAGNALLTLTSTTDPRNTIAFRATTSSAGITNADTFQSSLRSVLGVDTGNALSILSATSNLSQNTAGNIGAITVGTSTAAGIYALSYVVATTTFSLTNGSEVQHIVWNGTDTSISFNNGVNVALLTTAGAPTAFVNGQHVFSVVEGTAVALSFQVGELYSDTISLSISGLNTSTLGVSGTNVLSSSTASAAEVAIESAISAVTTSSAQLGAQQLQMTIRQAVNEISVENLGEALKSFRDTEMEKSMTNFTKFNVLSQVATAMLTQANQQLSQIITQLTRT